MTLASQSNQMVPTHTGWPVIKPIERLLTTPEVLRVTTIKHRNTLRRMVKAKQFPQPIKLSDNRIAWRSSTVAEWIAARERAA
jgi:prophage regulatory protein